MYSYFFCGNECERCIICTYPGAKKKCLFDILFNLLFFLLFKICSYPSLSRIKQTQRLFSFLLFFLSHTFFTFFFSSYFFSPFSLFSSAHTSFTFCLLSTLLSLSHSLSLSLSVTLGVSQVACLTQYPHLNKVTSASHKFFQAFTSMAHQESRPSSLWQHPRHAVVLGLDR